MEFHLRRLGGVLAFRYDVSAGWSVVLGDVDRALAVVGSTDVLQRG
jgi:hypothetical protein